MQILGGGPKKREGLEAGDKAKKTQCSASPKQPYLVGQPESAGCYRSLLRRCNGKSRAGGLRSSRRVINLVFKKKKEGVFTALTTWREGELFDDLPADARRVQIKQQLESEGGGHNMKIKKTPEAIRSKKENSGDSGGGPRA